MLVDLALVVVFVGSYVLWMVLRPHPDFPIMLEAARECLQDVYDLPALQEVMRDLGHRRVRIAEVTTDQPSPFASSLLFNYTGAFMYEGDTPLAEMYAGIRSLRLADGPDEVHLSSLGRAQVLRRAGS